MKKTAYDMLYLSVCAVNKAMPNSDYIARIDLDKLFQFCQFHSLTAIVCTALQSAGINDKYFIEAKLKAIRKNILLDAERKKICDFMEQNGIWYMPLKGAILKEVYPEIGMRQMSDNDILYDKRYHDDVMDYMKKCGYTAKSKEKSYHDTYIKPPIYNFEMHTELFGTRHDEKLYHYYEEIKTKLVKDVEDKYSYHFTDDDFYVYITTHEYKHYIKSGTGMRSLIDRYVFLNEKWKSLNWDYIARQTDALGISGYEQKSRELCIKFFRDPELRSLTAEEKKMLKFYLFSGTYGTQSNTIKNKVRNSDSESKLSYIWKRLFPDVKLLYYFLPVAEKYPFLIPFAWLFRLVCALTVKRKKIVKELGIVFNIDKSDLSNKK